MTKSNGITKQAPPAGHRGGTAGGEVTTYDLKEMTPVLVDALGLTKYLREHSGDDEETTE